MIFYTGTRVSGKSTEAIKLAFSTHSLLIVPTRDIAKWTERFAIDLGCPVSVIPAHQFFQNGEWRHRNIVIDELDWCIREASGANLLMVTSSGITLTEANCAQHPCLKTEAQTGREG